MQNIKMGKDTGHKPPKLSATNLSSLKKGRDVYPGPPRNGYHNRQNSDANNNGIFWNFCPFSSGSHLLLSAEYFSDYQARPVGQSDGTSMDS